MHQPNIDKKNVLYDYQDKQICNKCKILKPLNDFYNRKDSLSGKNTICKDCVNKRNKKDYINNKEKYLNYKKEWYENNKDHCSELKKQWRKNNIELKRKQNKIWSDKNKEKVINSQRKYREKNKEIINKKNIEYNKKNRDKYLINQKNFYIRHKDEIKKQKNKYDKKRRLSDSAYKLKRNIGSNFSRLIRLKTNCKKEFSFFKYTDFKYSEYIEHFKNQDSKLFENYCEKYKFYHIDHIIPASLYDFSDVDEIKKCWNPRNLRIITKIENTSKKDDLIISLLIEHNIFDLLPKGINIS